MLVVPLGWQVAEAEVPIFGLDVGSLVGSWLKVLGDRGHLALPEGAEHGRLTRGAAALCQHNAGSSALQLPPKT